MSVAKIYIAILFSLLLGLVNGQNFKRINELKYEIQIEENGNKRADQLIELSKYLSTYELEEALIYAYEALTVSKSIHYNKGKINAYFQVAHLESLNNNYIKAIESIQLASDISESYGDQKGVGIANIHMGDLYAAKGEYESARVYYQLSLDIGEKIKSNQLQALANAGFGKLSEIQGKDYLALQYFVLAKDFIVNTQEFEDKGAIYSHLGRLQTKTENLEDAIQSYQQSLKNYELLNRKEQQAEVCYELGVLYQKMNNPEEAILFMKNSLGLAQETGLEELIKKGFQTIAATYEKNDQYKEAYEYLKYFSAIKDTKEISELESQLELEMKNKEIELITKEKNFHMEQLENEKFYTRLGLIVGAIILGLALFLLILLRQRDRINSELIIATEESNRSRQEKEDFFAYTSHEIRTPLNAVVGMAKILGETDLDTAQQKYLKTITGSAQNILFLVNDVLDLSKIEKGAVTFEEIEFSLQEIVDQIIESLAFKKFEKQVDLIASIDENVPSVVIGDPIRFNQILLNLADNALKFTEKGSVTITLKVIDKHEDRIRIHFSVEDTGIGIRPEKLQTIFDSYQQEHISTTRQYGGTGLGLAISKLLIDKMGGEIQVESTPAEGSIFYFSVWLKTSDLASLNELNEKRITHTEKLQNLNILVVDDNQLNREIFHDMVADKKNKVKITLAENGQEAINLLEKSNFDLILMDLQMPVLNGYDASRAIRNKESWSEEKRNIPIIAMTAHVLDGVAEKCLEAGMNDSISKPVNVSMLHQKIKALITKKNIILKSSTSEKVTPETDSDEVAITKVNLDNLRSLVGDKPEKLMKYIQLFIQNVPIDLDALKDTISTENWSETKKVAHKIKGNLAYMGVESTKESILFLEQLDLEKIDLVEINTHLTVIEKEIILILEELNHQNVNTLSI